ncbi:hypothetical protein CSAL01_02797 [Colletotrichum salicis]|uniref:Uncharacterized protein n=1 Tax=Colletotrichum salicis TaxID=1209931 RepID=A0A135SZP0_9PEZI|nr:hypothetical protein CSAL01_02797 [Colletotrichum salicis]
MDHNNNNLTILAKESEDSGTTHSSYLSAQHLLMVLTAQYGLMVWTGRQPVQRVQAVITFPCTDGLLSRTKNNPKSYFAKISSMEKASRSIIQSFQSVGVDPKFIESFALQQQCVIAIALEADNAIQKAIDVTQEAENMAQEAEKVIKALQASQNAEKAAAEAQVVASETRVAVLEFKLANLIIKVNKMEGALTKVCPAMDNQKKDSEELEHEDGQAVDGEGQAERGKKKEHLGLVEVLSPDVLLALPFSHTAHDRPQYRRTKHSFAISFSSQT